MSGEHTHPELEALIVSVRAEATSQIEALRAGADRNVIDHERLGADLAAFKAETLGRLDELEKHMIRYSPVFKLEDKWALDCDGDEHLLKLGSNARGEWVPPVSGRLDPACYLNVDSFTLKDPNKPARLMVWMRRKAWNGKPADDTFLYDIWLHREGYVHHDWRAFWERGEGGRPVYWLYKVSGASAVTVDTRYVKYSLLT